jgi:hypothetical protein
MNGMKLVLYVTIGMTTSLQCYSLRRQNKGGEKTLVNDR